MSSLLHELRSPLVNNGQWCPSASDQYLCKCQQLKNLDSVLLEGHSRDRNGFSFHHSNDDYPVTEEKPLMTKLALVIQPLHDLDEDPVHARSSGFRDDSTMTSVQSEWVPSPKQEISPTYWQSSMFSPQHF